MRALFQRYTCLFFLNLNSSLVIIFLIKRTASASRIRGELILMKVDSHYCPRVAWCHGIEQALSQCYGWLPGRGGSMWETRGVFIQYITNHHVSLKKASSFGHFVATNQKLASGVTETACLGLYKGSEHVLHVCSKLDRKEWEYTTCALVVITVFSVTIIYFSTQFRIPLNCKI